MERLTEREPYWLGEEFWTSVKEPDEDEIDKVYERLKYYEDLQEQGRLLELPCAVGDTVFEIDEFEKEITKRKVYCIEIDDYGVTVMVSEPGGYSPYTGRTIDDFGKTVFLSKKEAEKALEGKSE